MRMRVPPVVRLVRGCRASSAQRKAVRVSAGAGGGNNEGVVALRMLSQAPFWAGGALKVARNQSRTGAEKRGECVGHVSIMAGLWCTLELLELGRKMP